MLFKIPKSWEGVFETEFEKDYFRNLVQFLEVAYQQQHIYPALEDVFKAFEYTSFDTVKVVLLGQDPYHGDGQAQGLSFSVSKNVKIPPSLRNIYQEIKNNDPEFKIPIHGDLSNWAKQGVLLLNATLSVVANKAGSHQKIGWEIFTNAIIKYLSQEKSNLVFILWGNYAKNKIVLLDSNKHLILSSAHPSPLAAYQGFWHQNHFNKANDYLEKTGQKKIDWQV